MKRMGNETRERSSLRERSSHRVVHWAKKLGIHPKAGGDLSTEMALTIFIFQIH